MNTNNYYSELSCSKVVISLLIFLLRIIVDYMKIKMEVYLCIVNIY